MLRVRHESNGTKVNITLNDKWESTIDGDQGWAQNTACVGFRLRESLGLAIQ